MRGDDQRGRGTSRPGGSDVSGGLSPAPARVRKVRPPDGIHPVLGMVRVGGVYEVDEMLAAAMCESGEFERAAEPRKGD